MSLVLLMALAGAQVTGGEVPELNAQSWRPSVDSKSFLWMTDSALLQDQRATGRALFAYSSPSLVYQDADTGEQRVLMGHLAELDLIGAFTFGPARVGLVAPIFLYGTSDPQDQAGLGDLVLDGKLRILDRDQAPLGVALSLRGTLPTASVDLPLGSAGVLYELEGAVDRAFGDTLLAVNFGHRGQPRVDLENGPWDDQFYTRLGAAQRFGERTGLGAEWITALSYANLDQAAILPSELLFEGWQGLNDRDLVLRGGVGVGLGNAVGIPAGRVILTLAYEPGGAEPDSDGDGIVDVLDQCPNVPEDPDGRLDEDGCPDQGSARFAFVDPEGAEVAGASWTVGEREGAGDEAIELDPGPWIVRARADGMREAEVGFEVPADGELVVRVPMEWVLGQLAVQARTPGGEELAGATWVIGTDGTATATGASRSLRPGTYTVRADAVGYRSASREVVLEAEADEVVVLELVPARVEVKKDRIDIRESIYFETAKAVIKPESFGLLDEVAQLVNQHPELTKIRIEGHTDSQGPEAYNLKLSDDRAGAVRTYLIEAGVDGARLEAEGFGESRPLVKERTAEDRARNRRVDFLVAERSDD